jgi:hypothetical protein
MQNVLYLTPDIFCRHLLTCIDMALLNVLEGIGNMIYLYKTEVSGDPVAPLIGFGIASATISKPIMFWAKEYFCNFCSIGHNSMKTAITMWWIPTG